MVVGKRADKVVPRETIVSVALACVFHVEHTKLGSRPDDVIGEVVSRETGESQERRVKSLEPDGFGPKSKRRLWLVTLVS